MCKKGNTKSHSFAQEFTARRQRHKQFTVPHSEMWQPFSLSIRPPWLARKCIGEQSSKGVVREHLMPCLTAVTILPKAEPSSSAGSWPFSLPHCTCYRSLHPAQAKLKMGYIRQGCRLRRRPGPWERQFALELCIPGLVIYEADLLCIPWKDPYPVGVLNANIQ